MTPASITPRPTTPAAPRRRLLRRGSDAGSYGPQYGPGAGYAYPAPYDPRLAYGPPPAANGPGGNHVPAHAPGYETGAAYPPGPDSEVDPDEELPPGYGNPPPYAAPDNGPGPAYTPQPGPGYGAGAGYAPGYGPGPLRASSTGTDHFPVRARTRRRQDPARTGRRTVATIPASRPVTTRRPEPRPARRGRPTQVRRVRFTRTRTARRTIPATPTAVTPTPSTRTRSSIPARGRHPWSARPLGRPARDRPNARSRS